jgi:hypothetical protein
MRRLRHGAAFIAFVTMGLAVASASSLAAAATTLGASEATVPRCTTGALGVTQNLSASTVVSVTVSGLPSTCASATIQVTVNNGSTTGSGSAVVPAGGGSITVTLAAAPAVAAGETTDVVLTGP